MIAKNKKLNISVLKKSSLQFSLQSCKLSTFNSNLILFAFSLLKQMLLQTVCKENVVNNQAIIKFSFAALFAKNPN
jgi:hypothetical protein